MNTLELEKNIRKIMNELVYQKLYACSVDVLIKLNYLTQKDYEDWRFGRIPYLEKVLGGNLHKLSTINRMIKQQAKKMSLKPSWTGYNKLGKVPKQRLRFSKSGIKNIEKDYATHYVSTYKIEERKIKTQDTSIKTQIIDNEQ